jgi:hypothetical protein
MTNTCPIGAGPVAVVEVAGAVVVVVELAGAALLEPDDEQAPATSTNAQRNARAPRVRRVATVSASHACDRVVS